MIELEMVKIPAGEFVRGIPLAEAFEAEESPEIRVKLGEYEIGRYPVIVSQWFAFLDSSGYKWPKDEWRSICKEKRVMPDIVPDAPISYVTWYDAKAFCDWITSKEGRPYSLPSEDQWEKACRGCDARKFPWGNLQSHWQDEFLKEADSEGLFLLRPVGRHPQTASAFGCQEMWSGVQEWCEDWYLLDFVNSSSPDNDLPGKYKAVRGGNTISAGWPRCTARQRIAPEERSPILGFRVVRLP